MEAESVTSFGGMLEQSQKLRSNRPIFTFEVPSDIAKDTGYTSIGIVQLTGNEEVAATRRANGNMLVLGSEMARESLKRLNKKVLEDGDAELFWATPANSQLRTLIVTAYNKVNIPSQAQATSFLESMTVSSAST